jgi:signal transduction histidine kinase
MRRPLHSDDRHTRMVAVVGNQVGALIARRREQTVYEAQLLHARDAAEAASRAKSDFLSRMSHELRTPLNSVIGFANVMLKNKGGRLSKEELEYLDRITSNGKHLLSLVNDILDIAKVEAGRLTVSKAMVNVDELLHDVVAQLQGQPRPATVDFRAEAPNDMVPLETDGALLRQVLINLTGNALRFTHSGSVVLFVEAGDDGRPARIGVRDTGIGIAPDRLGAIFEPFEQADESTHTLYGGTGLGLAISKSICDELGFELTVESEEGHGSLFAIRTAVASDGPGQQQQPAL